MNLNPFPVGVRTGSGLATGRLNPGRLLFIAVAFGIVVPLSAQVDRPPAPGVAVGATEANGPKIEFASPNFDFGKVKQGEVVRHDFVFKNTGTTVLEITDVHPGCGCTTAGNWDKRVEPGRTGVIPLQLNSGGFSGTVIKTANVTSNDPRQPNITLQIKGDVWTPFAVTPTMALFTVSSETETSETKVVRIVSQLDQPVELSGVEGINSSFRAELNPVKSGKEFELKITTVPPFGSSVSAPLTIKTSSSESPALSVLAQLIVQQPVMATPERITLPAGPLLGSSNHVVTVRNNGKNALTLSDASVNAPGAAVSVQEVQAGKLFHLTVKFPVGFELRPEQIIEVSVKSNHPKFPVIRVPVVAAPRVIAPAKA